MKMSPRGAAGIRCRPNAVTLGDASETRISVLSVDNEARRFLLDNDNREDQIAFIRC